MAEIEVIERPNGKLYRPRKPMRACCWQNDHTGEGGVVVLGTHDVERARPLAASWCDYWHEAEHAISPKVGWYRLAMRDGERTWIDDEVAGAPGVMFTASEDPEVSA